MLTVHHLGISQSERIVWLCEELAIPYELKLYERDPTTRPAPDSYRALHPVGTAPIITDGDLVLPESGAIIDYIIGKYGDGRLQLTASDPDFAHYLFWFHFANASMMPNAMVDVLTTLIGNIGESDMIGLLKARGEKAYALLEQHLGRFDYTGGRQFTAADIMMVFPLTRMRMFAPRDLSAFPDIRAYLKRIGERPAYRRAMEKGDPGLPLQLD